jgi:hypothetical protein
MLSCQNPTKSNAAIFGLEETVSLGPMGAAFRGSYLPTRRVAVSAPSGARSCHEMRSGGFCDAGWKNEATAVSGKLISSWLSQQILDTD